MFSWAVLILPQLDQATLHDRFDFDVTVLQQSGDPQAEFPAMMLCPSDQALGRYLVDAELTAGKRFAKANYAAYVGPFHVDNQAEFPGAIVGNGQRLAAITDGTSSTLMLAEVRARAHEQDQRGAWALPWTGASLLAFDMHHKPDATTPYEPHSYTYGQTQRPNTQGPTPDMIYKCEDQAGRSSIGCPAQRGGPDATSSFRRRPEALHPGGVNVAFVDGHVGFLPDDVDEIAMAFLVSANDTHVIDRDSIPGL